MARQWGAGDYRYELVENWPKVAVKGVAADVAGDSNGRIYTVVRDPRADGTFNDITPATGHMLVFDRDGALLDTLLTDEFSSPHGLWINGEDEIFHADCGHHTVTKYSTTGEVLMTIGAKGESGALGKPFNMCSAIFRPATRGGRSLANRVTSESVNLIKHLSFNPLIK